MDLYKLIRICDSKEDDYKETAQTLSDNFYAKLLYKVSLAVQQITKSKSDRSSDVEREFKILGNNCLLLYSAKKKQIALYVNGDLAYQGALGDNNAVNSIVETVKSEVKGDIKVNRPSGRKIQKDRQELNSKFLQKNGLTFPKSVYNAMLGGKDNLNVLKKNYKNQPIISADEFNYLLNSGDVKESDYEKVGNNYVNKRNKFFHLKGEFGNIINNLDEALARNEDFLKFYEKEEYSSKSSVIFYNGEYYLLSKGTLRKR